MQRWSTIMTRSRLPCTWGTGPWRALPMELGRGLDVGECYMLACHSSISGLDRLLMCKGYVQAFSSTASTMRRGKPRPGSRCAASWSGFRPPSSSPSSSGSSPGAVRHSGPSFDSTACRRMCAPGLQYPCGICLYRNFMVHRDLTLPA